MFEIVVLMLGSGAGVVALWKTVQVAIERFSAIREKKNEYAHEDAGREAEFSQDMWNQLKNLQDELSEFKDDAISEMKSEIERLDYQVEELTEKLERCQKDMLDRFERLSGPGDDPKA